MKPILITLTYAVAIAAPTAYVVYSLWLDLGLRLATITAAL